MKTLIHPNKTIIVQYPNGQIRSRNCETSVFPEQAKIPNQRFPATWDLRVSANSEAMRLNTFKEHIEQDYEGVTWLEIIIGLLAVGLTALCLHI